MINRTHGQSQTHKRHRKEEGDDNDGGGGDNDVGHNELVLVEVSKNFVNIMLAKMKMIKTLLMPVTAFYSIMNLQ